MTKVRHVSASSGKAQRFVIISAVGSVVVITVASVAKGKFPSAKQAMATGLLYVGIAAISDADPALAGPISGMAFASIALAEGLQFAQGVENVQKYKGSLPSAPGGSAGSTGGSSPVSPSGAPFAPQNPLNPTAGGAAGIQRNIVAVAQTWLGTPYQWGGNSRKGVDCSGLTRQVYGSVNINIPRVSTAQYHALPHSTDTSKLQPGDEVFFNWPTELPPGHCGIYIGGGQFIHAPHTGDVVKVSNLNEYIASGAKWFGFTRPYAKGAI